MICAHGADTTKAVRGYGIVPAPKSVVMDKGELVFSGRIAAKQPELRPLAVVFSDEFTLLTGKKMSVADGDAMDGDVVLEIDTKLKDETYAIEVQKYASVRGGGYNAVAMGTVTLLQAISVQDSGDKAPHMTLIDEPHAAYRGLLIDLARHGHKLQTLKQLVVMCRWYKIRYLQLHMTDDESFTFSSKTFPNAATAGRHYTLEELQQLETFACDRGVTLVPELETPGHSASLRKALPQLNCTSGGGAMCPGSESTYAVIDTLVGEMCAVFKASPYFHAGCDEVNTSGWSKCDTCKAYMQKHDLENTHELFRHFIGRAHEIVKKHGKLTIVWEGFQRGGKTVIPREILIMPFEGGKYYRPDHLVEDGYTLINTSWQPLYVVSHRPAPIGQWSPEYIYKWNMFRWEHFRQWAPAYDPIQLPSTAPVIGAQMCAWEQPDEVEIPSLRLRLPAMSERLWSSPAVCDFKDFSERLTSTDAALTKLLQVNPHSPALRTTP